MSELDKFDHQITECHTAIKAQESIITMLQQQKELFLQIQQHIPDVTISWTHGCVRPYTDLTKPIFYAPSVNQNYTELSFGSLGCCQERTENPYFARAIRECCGQRVRGTERICIGRYGDDAEGYDPEPGWETKVRQLNGDAAVETVQRFLDAHPFHYLTTMEKCLHYDNDTAKCAKGFTPSESFCDSCSEAIEDDDD